ncbi:MAG: Hsp20/alpha crystallin family protein [Mycobacterium leprae]
MTQPPGKPAPPLPGQPPQPAPAVPPVDLNREGNHLVLTVSLPGLRAGDFRLSLVGSRQVYIDGTVPYLHPVPQDSLKLAERTYGPFSRRIDLPLPVDSRGAQLRFEQGILRARLPLLLQRIPLNWTTASEEDGHAGPP